MVVAASISMNSCTDQIKFGNDFLEKAPGGTVTADTVFTNAEYTRRFLSAIYAMQYHPMPSSSTNSPPQCRNYWKGMVEALGDTYHLFFSGTIVFDKYYTGALTSQTDGNNNGNIHPFLNEFIWENVRRCYTLIENIDRVPAEDMDASEKARLSDEARCLLVNTYFTAFRHYGGLPIIEATFSGSESEYNLPRASVDECVKFMVGILDQVIASKNIPWAYTGAQAASETGRWTIAGAMALKIKILQFAASPLFNDNEPYYGTQYTLEDPSVSWYGNYDKARWTAVKKACEDFFTAMAAGGHYQLVTPSAQTQEAYAYAYRSAYMLQSSTEVVHSVRQSDKAHSNDYGFYNLSWGSKADGSKGNTRFSYSPTQEFVEMFPWADGTPFDWDELEAGKKVLNGEALTMDNMFIKGERNPSAQMLANRKYTRDPRLYETVAVNGALVGTDWANGKRSGQNYELWVGGTLAGNGPVAQNNMYPTGYRNLKYVVGESFRRKHAQWVALPLSDVYLTYAEALLQADSDNAKAIELVDAIRARVGLGGLAECNPDKNLLSDDAALLEEILRERAIELSYQEARYFDMIRYKRTDLFERTLHRLLIYRQVDGKDSQTQWYNSDRTKAAEGSELWYEPSHFRYEKQPITVGARKWWTDGFDPKWYLQPFPITEINKGYGLTQNAGW